jgi:hypothetical protein
MKYSLNQRGSSHLVLVLAVVVIAVVAAVGYRVLQKEDVATTTTSTSTATPAKLNSAADVDKASSELDSTNVDDVNPNQLDSDLESL